MRNSLEITRGYQIWFMIKRELVTFACMAFVQFALFINTYTNDIVRSIAGVIFALIYAFMIFDGASVLGKFDNKPYTPLTRDYRYPVIWGVIIAVINVLMYGMFWANWHFGDPVSVVINIIFYIVESPFLPYLIMLPKTLPVYVTIMGILIPIVMSVLGYLAGKNEFAISDKISSIMFEKTQKDA